MTGLLALVEKLATRPSTVWRLSWLAFCLLVICYAGAPTLRRVAPYILAGIGDKPSAPLLPKKDEREADTNDGWFLTWGLPVIAWAVTAALLGKHLFLS
ncbi:hypothetical protein [Dactylosporangium sp. CA-139066]|uniref:hypothetical protein n=1 Tax=Dactylosporangium sp. CA-139066 TaxID=3239930 RepID=UPI003D8ECFE2